MSRHPRLIRAEHDLTRTQARKIATFLVVGACFCAGFAFGFLACTMVMHL